MIVNEKGKVKLSIGKYEDSVQCDVVPMEACHIFLGIPCQFDKKTMHNGLTNEITFTHKEKKFVLHPLSPSQVVEDQVQMRNKINEKTIERSPSLENKDESKGERLVFLHLRLFNMRTFDKINL